MNITIAVPWKDRDPDDPRNWKAPFEKISNTASKTKIRGETEWSILLHVHGKDEKKIHKLTADLKVETVMDLIGEGQKFLDQETWEDKFGPSVVEGEGA